jgi:phosphoglycolate phosphatase-like HAD superfamily hydrolase
MRPLYIFDLDGTLALIDHRRHYVEGDTKDWRAFFAACVNDVPNTPVVQTMQRLENAGSEIWVWSGRSDEVRKDTVHWLQQHCGLNFGFLSIGAPERFLMRKAGDFRPDEELKREWLSMVEPPEYRRLTAVFDDRDKVVAMWRAAGVPCFQVAPGAF